METLAIVTAVAVLYPMAAGWVFRRLGGGSMCGGSNKSPRYMFLDCDSSLFGVGLCSQCKTTLNKYMFAVLWPLYPAVWWVRRSFGVGRDLEVTPTHDSEKIAEEV